MLNSLRSYTRYTVSPSADGRTIQQALYSAIPRIELQPNNYATHMNYTRPTYMPSIVGTEAPVVSEMQTQVWRWFLCRSFWFWWWCMEFLQCFIFLRKFNMKLHRNSQDGVCNNAGNSLLETCKSSNLFILNGRCGKDKKGAFTFKNTTIIDYAILSAEALIFFSQILKSERWMLSIQTVTHC